MLNVDLSIGDVDGQAVVALRGESNLADIPSVASHLIAAVAACGPSVIVDLAGLERHMACDPCVKWCSSEGTAPWA